MTDLDKLIEAVEAGNPEWDADFMDGLIDWDMNPRPAILVLNAWNGSLNAAKRLHDALLPGWGWDLCDDGEAKVFEYTSSDDSAPFDDYIGVCRDNPARAWLLAILRAVKAKAQL